ncbi:chromatin-remodeling complex ATPase chain Iswi-like isoform X4 [Scylla paramamosain]|uniref:chromatin-remodeling complex ATPase chain Iswi-like isoform X4 n=1 Tax=Scylla paramamosain TaxID=85552 RepID=UPI003082F9CC
MLFVSLFFFSPFLQELPIQRPGSGVILCHLYHQDQDQDLYHQDQDQEAVRAAEEKMYLAVVGVLRRPREVHERFPAHFFQRQVKRDVNSDIPPKRELLVYTPVTPLQLSLYTATLTSNMEAYVSKNPQCDLQAQDHCHRTGQMSPVLVLCLITAASTDEWTVERAGTKRKLERLIIRSGKFRDASQGDRSFQRVVGEAELLSLLKQHDHHKEHRASKGHEVT